MKLSFLSLIFLLFASAFPAMSADQVIRFGLNDAHGTPYVEAMGEFARRVQEGSDGRIEVQIFPSAQLGSIPEMFENVQVGAQEMSVLAPAYASQFFPAFDVLELPYLATSPEEGRRMLESDALANLMAEAESVLGVKLLGVLPVGFRNVANSRHPVNGLADMAGLKLRTQSSPVHLAAFQAMGASPVAIGWGETYQAVQSGVVDGLENSMSILIANSFPEVARHVSTTRHVFGTLIVAMNADLFNRLSAEDQQLILDAYAETERVNFDLLQAAETEALATLAGMGASVVELGPEVLAEMRESVAPVHAEYGPRFEPHFSAIKAAIAAGE